ncbi:MAG: YfhO family protein [Acidimicrobiales bacterium]
MRHGGVARRRLPDVLGVAWTVLAVVAVMAPVLRPGVHLGSFDLLSRIGLTKASGVRVHSQFPADQALYFVPLTNLAWTQVHQGHLPLWNPYNVLGVPIAFTWQSGVFSVPVLLSYLVPVHAAYTVIVLSKLIIAGTGAYTLCRVLGTGPVAAAFGGTAFELSGPMVHYAGWAMTSVTCWSGWIFAAAFLLVRGSHRLRHGILLALAVGAAVYGGHPESLVVLAVSLLIFVGVLVGVRAHRVGGALRRPIVDVLVAGACGAGLGAPLILPGLQVVQASGRAAASGGAAFGLTHVTDLATAVQGTDFRVPSPYLGVLSLVLAVVALRVLWRRAVVLALGAVAAVGLLLVFQTPLYSVVQAAPEVGQVTWNRDVMLVALAVAVLGALGLDALVRATRPAVTRRWSLGGLGVAAVVVGLVALAVGVGAQHTGSGSAAGRLAAAGASVVVGLALVAAAGQGGVRRVRWAAAGLVATQTVVLVVAGVSSWSISSGTFPTTVAVRTLQRTVGTSLVSIDTCQTKAFSPPLGTEVGIRPNANVAYGVHEFAAYEPALPTAYFDSWEAVSGTVFKSNVRRVGLFCPDVTTAAEARIYGVSYILALPHTRTPAGAQRVGTVGGEELFHVTGSAQATVSALAPPGRVLADDAPGTPVAASHPSPSSLRVVTDAAGPRMLRLRVTALPGWSATIDGRPLSLRSWASGSMLEAEVPAGHHVVELQYWPKAFTEGIVLAGIITLGGLAALALHAFGGRYRRPSNHSDRRRTSTK